MTSKPVVSFGIQEEGGTLKTISNYSGLQKLRGTPTGNAIVPVLKVTANSRTFKMMEDNMDVDLSAIISGEKTYKLWDIFLNRGKN